ncbi:MAG: hypothetical protein Q4F17_09185 [Eubacteriales bacterium]|nr:hypothetical protein [Eubacteriales bacterium]
MKTLNTIVKIITALAAVAGVVYVVATYGDRIVAWAKRLMESLPKCPACDCTCAADDGEFAEAPVEDAPAQEPQETEEAPAEEAPAQEAPVQDPAPANEPVAEENDFAE